MSTGPAVAIMELRIFGLKSAKFESAELTGATIIGPAVTVGLRSAKVKLTESIGPKAGVAITESSVFSSKGFEPVIKISGDCKHK
jgi:hypothetical protein